MEDTMGMNMPSVAAKHQEGGLIGTGTSRDTTIDPDKGPDKVPLAPKKVKVKAGTPLSELNLDQLRVLASTKHRVRTNSGRVGACCLFQPPCREGCQGSMKVAFANGGQANCLVGDLLTA